MEGLSQFVASVVEFLVSGVLFTLAMLYFLSGLTGLPQLNGPIARLFSPESSFAAFIFVAIAYAMGVVAESLSRGLFEFLLDRVTVRRQGFLQPEHPLASSSRGLGAVPAWRIRFTEFFLGGDYTVEQRNRARAERDGQRAMVMTFHLSLNEEVQGQLKRLRLERVFTLSSVIVTISLLSRGSFKIATIAAVISAVLIWLVHTRFLRYCSAIGRAYDVVTKAKVTQTSSGVETGGVRP